MNLSARVTEEVKRKWVDQLDQIGTNRKARRHPAQEHDKRGFTKPKRSRGR